MTTSDIIIDRVAELWARMLKNPKFDNGDTSSNGGMALALAVIGSASHTKDAAFVAKVDAFKGILAERLKFLRDHDGEVMPESEWQDLGGNYRVTNYRFRHHTSVDYDPDELLDWAARAAGFEHTGKTLFPWKTDVSFYDENCVSVSAGYGAEQLYHYPLSNGRWLICELRGNDMPKIIAAIEAGLLAVADFTIEQPG